MTVQYQNTFLSLCFRYSQTKEYLKDETERDFVQDKLERNR